MNHIFINYIGSPTKNHLMFDNFPPIQCIMGWFLLGHPVHIPDMYHQVCHNIVVYYQYNSNFDIYFTFSVVRIHITISQVGFSRSFQQNEIHISISI